nr:pentatricopeptide repeat-containing protein At2g03380, mitochondrial [Aegilops tauschii subsp. strangulata]XP_040252965.1 pentatricopeptide repeat-containing protein At2g03380, mitochondrial [Aegilops tauschii subsp. strangulata]XP_040252966.1 pentatricopeptide repeat-containing protein At2g03380, mitochondrial [Aegilops tauschii subsp. strangulata]XP_040252967.1 pentatricopeptide repeat-containing protein At2g03380, mitochondrial [Aegilops tauschii subsp. strangulata]XP_040252968.1 pentatri
MRRRCPEAQDDVVLLSLALKASVRSADFRYGRRLHCDAVKAGGADGFVMNCLVDMYAKAGDLENARKVFDRILSRNVVSWTSMLSGCLQNGFAEEGLALFNEMREERVLPSEHTMASVLTACTMLGSLHQGRWVHGSVIKHGMVFNPFVTAVMLDMYVKCGEVEDARRLFDELGFVDLVLWTTMIVGYTQNGSPLDALLLFADKKFVRIVPNSVTIATVLSASAQLRNLSLGRLIHGMSVKLGVVEKDVVMNALVDMYAKCKAVSEANGIFGRISNKDVVTWNSLIAGYVENDMGNEALMLFSQMRVQGSSPDAISVVNALSACVCLGDLLIGKCFHTYAIKRAFLSNIYVNTALLNLYNKCADLPSAQRVFSEMNDRNSVTWGAMIGGYGMQGDSAGSIDLFNEMLKDNIQPNEVVFTSILSTCSHTGMVSVGKKCFESMAQYFNITPSMKHYACMVDVLSRAGNLEEALDFIQKMPMQADISVWGAFLHGCKLHSRLEFGEEAINRMMVPHPDTPAFYVLMSNLYTSYGRWDKSLAIRRSMQERGLVKLPGCSSVGLENG